MNATTRRAGRSEAARPGLNARAEPDFGPAPATLMSNAVPPATELLALEAPSSSFAGRSGAGEFRAELRDRGFAEPLHLPIQGCSGIPARKAAHPLLVRPRPGSESALASWFGAPLRPRRRRCT